jgi:hypothetical protein
MKQFLLAVHYIEGDQGLSDDETQTMFREVELVNDEMKRTGAWVFAAGLLPPDRSTVVRTEGGRTTTTDGPFAETKEHIAGFWVLRCADLDEAHGWAEKCSRACMGPVEVRPFDALSNE